MDKLLQILKQVKPNVDFSKEDDLIESGILTSFDILRLVTLLNSEYDIEITPLYIIPENFKNAKAILELIEKVEEDD